MRLTLFQPDIPHNTGAILRLAACFALPVDIIGPCGFLWDDKRLRRAGMDYRELAAVTHHESWTRFMAERAPGRLVLLTTRGTVAHHAFAFAPGDSLILGRESAGVTEEVYAAADARITIPMAPGARSLNVGMAAAVVAGEALRQTGGWPTG